MQVLNHCAGCADHHSMTTEELTTAWLAERKRMARSAESLRVWAAQCRTWRRHVGDDADPWQVTREQIIEWITDPPSAHTQRSRRAWLVSLYGWAGEVHGWASPLATIPGVAVPAEHHGPIPDDVLERVKARATQTDRTMLALGRLAGMRAAEIAGANASWLDGREVRILGKGRKQRCIAAHPVVRGILDRASDNPGGHVFPSPTRPGEAYLPNSISHRLRLLLPDPWTAHSLRRAFAHDLYRACGRDIELVRQALGHASVTTTQLYLGVRSTDADAHILGMDW